MAIMMTRMKKNNFTLLEIFICVAILAVAAVTVGWQMKNMVSSHHFHQNVANMVTDLKKCQVIALADRIDIEMRIQKVKDHYEYRLYCDEPNTCLGKKSMTIGGVKSIRCGKKVVDQLTIPIYSSGRIEKTEIIRLYQDEEKGIELDLTKPHLIKQKKIQL